MRVRVGRWVWPLLFCLGYTLLVRVLLPPQPAGSCSTCLTGICPVEKAAP